MENKINLTSSNAISVHETFVCVCVEAISEKNEILILNQMKIVFMDVIVLMMMIKPLLWMVMMMTFLPFVMMIQILVYMAVLYIMNDSIHVDLLVVAIVQNMIPSVTNYHHHYYFEFYHYFDYYKDQRMDHPV